MHGRAQAGASAAGTPGAQLNEDNQDGADWRDDGMAVIVKYVVVWNGKEDMVFTTKQEAETHDKMIAIAERLYTFLETAELHLPEDTLEALTIFMAQHREHLGTLLKGGTLKAPAVRAPRAAVQPATRDETSASTHKRSKALASAPPTPPQAAA
jgi:dsDNA-binding SOS-regulon protein